MTKRKAALKVGDEVALKWCDIVSFGRLDHGSDSDLPLAEFVSYGKISYIGTDKIVLRNEEEIENPPRQGCREPTAFPVGCIRSIRRFSRSEEVTFKAVSRNGA